MNLNKTTLTNWWNSQFLNKMHNKTNFFTKNSLKSLKLKKNLVYILQKLIFPRAISGIKCELATQRSWGGDWFTFFMQDPKQYLDPGLDPKQNVIR